jgi:hypothetical protein
MRKILIFICLLLLLSSQYVFSNNTEDAYLHYKQYQYSSNDIKQMDFDTVYLAAVTPTSDSLGSLAAHAFIILTHGDDINSGISLNYFAYHERMFTFEKTFKAATVGLEGYVDIRPFTDLAERYTIGQNRTLFVYKTKIETEKIPSIIDEFYKYKESDLTYRFFTYNCSSLQGSIFSSVLSSEEKEYRFPNFIMPGRLIYLFEKNGLLLDEHTISPPLIKRKFNNTDMGKNEINDRHDYFKVHEAETTTEAGFSPIVVSFDNFESNTIFSEKVSKLYLGMDTLDSSFGLSVFDNQIYEQRQSAVILYEFKVLDTLFSINSNLNLKVDKFTIIETGKYPKINIAPFEFSTYFSLKLNPNNYLVDVNGGYGISVGGLHSIFTLIPIIETNISNLILTLKIKSSLCLYTKNAFVLLNLDYPIYNKTVLNTQSLELKAGYKFNDLICLEASYDILNKNYNVYFKYLFYPLLF